MITCMIPEDSWGMDPKLDTAYDDKNTCHTRMAVYRQWGLMRLQLIQYGVYLTYW